MSYTVRVDLTARQLRAAAKAVRHGHRTCCFGEAGQGNGWAVRFNPHRNAHKLRGMVKTLEKAARAAERLDRVYG